MFWFDIMWNVLVFLDENKWQYCDMENLLQRRSDLSQMWSGCISILQNLFKRTDILPLFSSCVIHQNRYHFLFFCFCDHFEHHQFSTTDRHTLAINSDCWPVFSVFYFTFDTSRSILFHILTDCYAFTPRIRECGRTFTIRVWVSIIQIWSSLESNWQPPCRLNFVLNMWTRFDLWLTRSEVSFKILSSNVAQMRDFDYKQWIVHTCQWSYVTCHQRHSVVSSVNNQWPSV